MDTGSDRVLSFDIPGSEFVFALVSPVGADNLAVQATLTNGLRRFGYSVNPIRISDFMHRFHLTTPLLDTPEYERIRSRMIAGNEACRSAKRNDFLALVAISEINKARVLELSSKIPTPRPNVAHVISSLKRPEEVTALRRVYGPGFLLIGIFATEAERLAYLTNDLNMPASKAEELMTIDTGEEDPHGQSTRETFHLADVFVRLKGSDYKGQLWRFLDLIFGNPFDTPTPDEYAMFLAHSAGLRSADLSRQVGAVVVSKEVEIIGLGCNDVPRPGGGQYWPGPDDCRDFVKGFDSNEEQRDRLIEDVVARLRSDILPENRLKEGRELLKDSPMLDITEYGRPVHAEMAAILACTRTGTSAREATLYCTTFPCHNCTKHIIAAGITRVVYIEPYPKSRAEPLHSDAIRIGEHSESADTGVHVVYEPFVGVGPRRYSDLFSMVLSSGKKIRRKREGQKLEWERTDAIPRVPMLPTSYLQRELLAVHETEATMNAFPHKEEVDGN